MNERKTAVSEIITVETRACMFCGASSRVEQTARQAAALADRRPVQDVLPDVEPARRELLISGTHPDCWARAFG